jgi:glycosyltransferase involved in cell wall biosynthesis
VDGLKVSVIVPVFNGEASLAECVDSLLALNYSPNDVELIFVNNASTDKTGEILTGYGDTIRVVSENKRGPAAARNKGLMEASHEIVAMTDADCTVDPDWLRILVSSLLDSSVGLAGGTILSKRPCNAIELFGERIHDHRMAIEAFAPPYVITMNWAARRTLLRELEFFNERFIRCEDVDLSVRAFQAGYKFVFVPQAIVYHRNERTYSGLFREGCVHGFYSVQAIKEHNALLRRFGHLRINRGSYRALVASFNRGLRGTKTQEARCDFVFNSGKKIGKLLGSVRFRYLDL